MTMIEYAIIAIDDAGAATIERFEKKQRALRVADEVTTPAETIQAELAYRHPDGRKGTLRGTVALPAIVATAEVKRGRDGKPAARPVDEAAKPAVHPWQRLTGPHHEIGPDRVTRYWLVEDRPLEAVQAERAGEIRAALREAVIQAMVEGADVEPLRAAARDALAAVEKAADAKAAWEAGRAPDVTRAAGLAGGAGT